MSGLPTAGSRFRGVSSSRLLEGPARPRPRARGPAQSRGSTARGDGPSSRPTTLWAQDRDRRGDGSGGPGCAPRRCAATSSARPASGSARSEATRLLPPSGRRRPSSSSTGDVPLLAVWSAVCRLPRHRGFHHPGDRSPGPSPSRSPPPLSTYLLVRRSSRHRHGPAATPADPQEHPGGLDLGDDPLGQVSVLPANLSPVGGLGHARPGPVAGHDHRRPEAAGAACWSRCTKRW